MQFLTFRILKDLAWVQFYKKSAIALGGLALAWCGVLFFLAIMNKKWEDVYMLVALTMWLNGNFWWMYGEVVSAYDDDYVYGPPAGHMFEVFHRISAWPILILLVCPLLDNSVSHIDPANGLVETRHGARSRVRKGWVEMPV